MNTSYTVNTALSKGVESTTRHHSPLTTEYISFQHIYKSYSERERNRGEPGGGLEEEKKPGASKNPDFGKQKQKQVNPRLCDGILEKDNKSSRCGLWKQNYQSRHISYHLANTILHIQTEEWK